MGMFQEGDFLFCSDFIETLTRTPATGLFSQVPDLQVMPVPVLAE